MFTHNSSATYSIYCSWAHSPGKLHQKYPLKRKEFPAKVL